ncbi:MAG: 2-oxoisovalerate dehydrogenase [Candidatus Kapabacteria bacterium]|nr:2-oxoisovalerate dehydrogenase [Candidatus Kapabacteria bacterium]
MNEIIFLVEEALEGGYTAKALDYSILTEADSESELKANIKDAVLCHFEPDEMPKLIHLHYVKDEIFAFA